MAALSIGIAATIVYANSFSGAFVLDDHLWIEQNRSIQHLWPISRWLTPADPEVLGGRPVLSLSLAVNYAFGRTEVWGYHLVNLAIHVLAGLTLFGVVRRTLRLPGLRERFAAASTPFALIVALIWTIHPLQTAAVTYVIQRTESLVGLFYLLTLYCVIRGATTEAGDADSANASTDFLRHHASSLKPPSLAWYVAAALSCLLGMATKEVMTTAPIVIFLYDRTFLSGSFRRAWSRRWGLYLALAATWGVVVWELFVTHFHGGSTGFAVSNFTWRSYLVTQPGVIARYLQLAFLPIGQCLDYGWPAADSFWAIAPAGLLIVGLLALTCWALVKRPALGFLGACFFLVLAPTSSIVPINDAAFEHRMYLPLAAVITLAALGLWTVWTRWNSSRAKSAASKPAPRWVAGVALIALLVALGCLTVRRNDDYRTEGTILQDAYAHYPHNVRTLNNLVGYLLEHGDTKAATGYLDEALRLDPDNPQVLVNEGYALLHQDKLDPAIRAYERALKKTPDYVRAHYELGLALTKRGDTRLAVAQFEEALRLRPDYGDALDDLAIALYKQGDRDQAIAKWNAALEIDPDFAKAHYNLANALSDRHDIKTAMAHWERAIEIDPNYVDAYSNLGLALKNLGQLDQAIARWQQALKIDPDYVKARIQIGFALERKGNFQDAAVHWQEANRRARPDQVPLLFEAAQILATDPDPALHNPPGALELARATARLTNLSDPNILNLLALTCAETNQFEKAVEIATRALKLAVDQKNSALADDIRGRLEQYQERIPKHESPGDSSAP